MPKVSDNVPIHERITATLVAMIEQGSLGEWRMPWHHHGTAAAHPLNVVSKRAYRGINPLLLWAVAEFCGFPTGLWGTYRQWQALGAQVRRGEKSTTVVFWKQVGATGERPADGTEGASDAKTGRRLFARAFSVFNAAQVDGYDPAATGAINPDERIAHAEAFFTNTAVPVVHGEAGAFYRPSTDQVHMPRYELFRGAVEYVGTLAHEIGHATGAKHRLDRQLGNRFGSDAYAVEELIAELAAAFVLSHLGIACEPRADHARYLASWLRVLKGDNRAIFAAASRAQAAVDWMIAQQPDARDARQPIADEADEADEFDRVPIAA